MEYFISLLYLLLASWGGIYKLWFQTFDDTSHDGSMYKFEAKEDGFFRRLVTMKTIDILRIATCNMILRTGYITHSNLCMHFVGCRSSMAWRSFLRSASHAASRSVSSLKFYFRMTVAWPLCLRHNIIRNQQGIFCNNANDWMTLGN